LLSVLIQVFSDASNGGAGIRVKNSSHGDLRYMITYSDPIHTENCGHEVRMNVRTKWGLRVLRGHGWQRPKIRRAPGKSEFWILGWTWNGLPLPDWDDSEHFGRTFISIG